MQLKVLGICAALVAGLGGAVVPAQAQYYPQYGQRGYPPEYQQRRAGRLVCVVAPEYRRSRRSCPVGGYGKAPGDYCECRLYNYGPTVPGVISAY